MIKALAVIVGVLILGLQYKAWFSDRGHFAVESLKVQVAEQEAKADALEQDNVLLREEVMALKNGLDAIEARARRDLGMVREDEVFFLVPEPDS